MIGTAHHFLFSIHFRWEELEIQAVSISVGVLDPERHHYET